MHAALKAVTAALRPPDSEQTRQNGLSTSVAVAERTEQLPFLSALEVDGAGVVPLPLPQRCVQQLLPEAQLSAALTLDSQGLVKLCTGYVWHFQGARFTSSHPRWELRVQELARALLRELGLCQVRAPFRFTLNNVTEQCCTCAGACPPAVVYTSRKSALD